MVSPPTNCRRYRLPVPHTGHTDPGHLDPIASTNCVIYPTVDRTGAADLAVWPVVSLGKRQGGNGNGLTCVLVHSRAEQTAA